MSVRIEHWEWQTLQHMADHEVHEYASRSSVIQEQRSALESRGYRPYLQVRRDEYHDLFVHVDDYRIFSELPAQPEPVWIYAVLSTDKVVKVSLLDLCAAITAWSVKPASYPHGWFYVIPTAALAEWNIKHQILNVPGLASQIALAYRGDTTFEAWNTRQEADQKRRESCYWRMPASEGEFEDSIWGDVYGDWGAYQAEFDD